MAGTDIRGEQIGDGEIQRRNVDVATVGQSLIRKLIAGTGLSLNSTGADAGTGDVTLNSVMRGDNGWLFGDKSDGTVTFSSGGAAPAGTTAIDATTFRMDRDVFYDVVTIDSGITLRTNGFRLFAHDLANNGTIENNGTAGGNGIDGGVTGGGGAAAPSGSLAGSGAGGAGGGQTNNGSPGASVTNSLGGAGGAGGDGDGTTGGAAGTATAPTASRGGIRHALLASLGMLVSNAGIVGVNGGGGGGGGGGDAAISPGRSGGAGGGGGVVVIVARSLANNGTIRSNGGDGGDAATDAGGGGPGGGGVLFLVYESRSAIGTNEANAGTPGNGAGGRPGGATGSSGQVIAVAVPQGSAGAVGSADLYEAERSTAITTVTTNQLGRVLLDGVFYPDGSTVEVDVSIMAAVQGGAGIQFVLVWNQTVAAGSSLAAEPSVPAFRYPAGSSYKSLGGMAQPGQHLSARVHITGLTPGAACTWELQWWESSGSDNWSLGTGLTPVGVDVYEPRLDTAVNVTKDDLAQVWNRDGRRFIAVAITGAGVSSGVHIYEYPSSYGYSRYLKRIAQVVTGDTWPQEPRFTPDGKWLFVGELFGAEITQIRVSDWTIERAIAVSGSTPLGLESKSDSSKVYVANNGQDTILPITVATGAVGTAIATNDQPRHLKRRPGTNEIYITCHGGQSVQKLNAATDAITATLSLGASQGPMGMSFTPDGTKCWVACNSGGVVREIDCATFTLTGRTVAHSAVLGCEVDPHGNTLHTVGANRIDEQNWRYFDLTVAGLDKVDGADFDTDIRDIRITADGAVFMTLEDTGRLWMFGGSVFTTGPSQNIYHTRVAVLGASAS